MCAPSSPPLCLLLWMAAATVSATGGEVHPEGNKTAVSGEPATLFCSYSLPDRVQQVLWRKTPAGGDTTTVAFYNRRGSHKIVAPVAGRIALSRSLGDTRLTIQPVGTEDEACYTCEFHAYPDGARSATACLSVYVLPQPEVSHVTTASGATEANCTTRSRPAASISWSVGGDNGTLGPPVSSAYDEGDGTTTVTSMLRLPPGASAAAVECVVRHRGLQGPLTASFYTDVLPQPEVSHVTTASGGTEANCTTRSRPAASISWSVGGDNGTLGPPVLSAYDEGDGTTTVTSTLRLPPGAAAVECVVRHRGLQGPLTASFYTDVLPQPEVSHVTTASGATEANCTTRSRPAASISWSVGGDNGTLGPPVLSTYDEGDGTTTVTSTLRLPPGASAAAVECVVRHRGLQGPLTVSLYADVGPDAVTLLSACVAAAVLLLLLLLGLCVWLCRCSACGDDR